MGRSSIRLVSAIGRGAQYVIRAGKVLLRGVEQAIARGIKSLREFGARLLSRSRFKGFRIRIQGHWFILEGRIIGVLDLPLQRHLFMKEMRMSKTEKKREMKDLEGNPQIKGERRRLQMMFASRPPVKKGVRHAAIIVAQEDRVVGLRYERDEAPVPLIVSKARGEAGDEMLAEARRLGLPVVEDATLLDQLIGKSIGDRIPPDTYTSVARLLVRFGV